MKLMVKIAMIATALTLSSVVMHSMAKSHSMPVSKKPLAYTIQNFEVMNVNAKEKSIIDCSKFANQSYKFNTANKQNHLTKNFYFINNKWRMKKHKHGLILTKWCATAVLVDAKGKKHMRKAYGHGVSIPGTKMSYGAFTNGFCRGFYKSTW